MPPARLADRAQVTVAVVGASAGGVEAAQVLFSRLPESTGIAFVLILHLDAKRESFVDHVIASHTSIPVVLAQDNMRLEPDRIHVAAPGRPMTLRDGVLKLGSLEGSREDRLPIDHFLRSVASDQGSRACCVILSGSGSDGARGVRDIVAAGGVTIVQDPATAGFDGMPQSAIATGLAEYVLPIAEIPAVLLRCAGRDPGAASPGQEADDTARLSGLLALVRARSGLNFEAYKKSTLMRRVHRRMELLHLDHLADFLALLRDNVEEVRALVRDFLIGVTDFFREPAAWATLERNVIRPLVRQADPGRPIRVWVAGCATGQEAYGVAMLFIEHIEASGRPIGLQVFASDVSEEAIATAREGRYPKSIESRVAGPRLRRFFARQPHDHHWQVRKELRESVIFATHNLFEDPPYSRMDLICCRNLLIYLEPETQQRVLKLFHFGLQSEGFLFLGPAESVGEHEGRFRAVSKKWRIFRRVSAASSLRAELPMLPRGIARREPQLAAPRQTPMRQQRLAELAQRLVLERFAPATVLVNGQNETLNFSGPTEGYLRHPRGSPTHDLLLLAREGLSAKLREALASTAARNAAVTVGDLRVKRGSTFHPVRFTVLPLPVPDGETGPVSLVVFEEEARPLSVPRQHPHVTESGIIRQLEDDLLVARGDLKTSLEQLESSLEESRVANEEVMSVNEELQSTNEELETSREELQSLNEELGTVNTQLQSKVGELEHTNNDLNNLLASTEIATLCVDRQHCIKWFTPATTNLLSLLPSDRGRSIGDFASRFHDGDLVASIDAVLHNLTPLEQTLLANNGRWYIQRVLPYRTEEDRIAGVVVTFTDITNARKAESDLEALNETLERRVEERTLHLRLVQQAAVVANEARTLDTALAQTLELVCRNGGWVLGYALLAELNDPDTFLDSGVWWQATSQEYGAFRRCIEGRRYSAGSDPTGHVIEYGEGRWIPNLSGWEPPVCAEAAVAAGLQSALILPVLVGRRTVALLNVFSDRRLEVDEAALAVMTQVAAQLGRAVERARFDRRLADLTDEERRQLGQEVHDGIGQQLVGLGMLATSLRQALEAKGAQGAAEAAEVVAAIDEARAQVRALTKGLLPVQVEKDALLGALEGLAAQFSLLAGVDCRFIAEDTIVIPDGATATHLFRIAQEAIRNSVEHGHARHVTISLEDKDRIRLTVRDDGVGMTMAERFTGNGLRIMRYRADLIGAALDTASTAGEGVVVTCVVPHGASRGNIVAAPAVAVNGPSREEQRG